MQKNYRVVVVLPGEARHSRLAGVQAGKNPREFFYGALALGDIGCEVVFLNARQVADTALGRTRQYFERKLNGVTQIGLTRSQVKMIVPHLNGVDFIFGFTDSFSLSMGYYRDLLPRKIKVIGGFHGLADWRGRVRKPLRGYFDKIVNYSLHRLDYAMTSGSADQDAATIKYCLPEGLLQHYDFGVDQEFWSPAANCLDFSKEAFFLAVGSDPQRDYGVISKADLPEVVKVVTKLDEPGLKQNPKTEVIRGSLASSQLSDEDIRDLYRSCRAVIVPVKDVWQPSGCSVTLQAMSCGKPVVITDYKGLFDRGFLRDGENCLLMPPGNPIALQQAMLRLSRDQAFYSRISEGALRTAREHFGISRLESKVMTLVDRFGGDD